MFYTRDVPTAVREIKLCGPRKNITCGARPQIDHPKYISSVKKLLYKVDLQKQRKGLGKGPHSGEIDPMTHVRNFAHPWSTFFITVSTCHFISQNN